MTGAARQAIAEHGIRRLTMDLDPEMHRAFKVKAARDETTMVEAVRSWIAAYIAGKT